MMPAYRLMLCKLSLIGKQCIISPTVLRVEAGVL